MSFVGNKIQHFRNEKKITIEELSQQTGIGIEQLKRIEENADLPALSILLKSPGFGIAFRHITRRPRQLGAGCIKYQLCRSEFLDQFGADTCTHVLPLVGSEQSQPAHGAVYHRNISY